MNTLAEKARAQFPALQRTLNGQPVIYADNPGGTQVPQSVADAISDYLLHRNANTHGAFVTSQLTDETIAEARLAMADLLTAPSPDEIVFGPNMTTLTFLISRSIGRLLSPGDEIVVTALDHDANFSPWVALEERGAVIRQVGLHREDVTLDLSDFERLLSPRTKVVAVGHASNAVGTINPIPDIVAMVRALAPEAIVYVDAVQSVPHIPVHVAALGADIVVSSSYKFFGPHMGILWGRYELLDRLPAYKVRPAGNTPPDKFEPGTKNHECMAGVTAAVNYLASLAPDGSPDVPEQLWDRRARLHAAMLATQLYEQELSTRLIQGLSSIPGASLYGITDPARFHERVPTVALSIKGRTPLELAERLGEQGIFAWNGNYYAVNVMELLQLEPNGALRLGLAHYNTVDEVDRIVETLAEL